MQMNLLEETVRSMSNEGLTPNDVKWIGARDGEYAITWKQFEIIANVNYDASYGSAEVAEDLVVVGSDWWLERHEYDGSEWWEFKKLPTKKDNAIPFNLVLENNGYSTITINKLAIKQASPTDSE